METLRKIKEFQQLVAPFTLRLNEQRNTLEVQAPNPPQLYEEILQLGFGNSDYSGDGCVEVHLMQLNLLLYLDKEDFVSRVEPGSFHQDLLVLSDKAGDTYYYEQESGSTFRNFSPSQNDYFFENVKEYFHFLEFLKTQDHQEDKPFYFVDHFDDTRGQFIFTSSKKEGKLSVPFRQFVPKFAGHKPLKPVFDEFKGAFQEQNKHLPKFIKIELFNVLPKVSREERMEAWISKMPEMLHTAQQNFEIYLHDLSLDKLKSEYQKSQEEYFTKLREALGKVINQTIAFPVSITATAFATFKVNDPSQPTATFVLLGLIVLAFMVFTGFTAFLLGIQEHDISELKANFDRDYNKLAKNKFFENEKNAEDRRQFEEAKHKVEAQFGRLKLAIKTYFGIQAFFNTLFLGFILMQMGLSVNGIVVFGLVFGLILGILFRYFLAFHQ